MEIIYNEQEALIETYITKIKELNQNKKLKAQIITYGCQMNAHDSEKILGLLKEMGYEETEIQKEADLILFNTCCVRENAENKVYGNLGFLKTLKEKNKNLKIVLCGCMMQQDIVVEKIKESYKYVDIIFGTYNLFKLPLLLHQSLTSNKQIIDIWQDHKDIVDQLPKERLHKFKASVNIMYGCDNYCSYCIVPYVRGRERSREKESIIKEINQLVQDGVKEVTLLGQNVNSYGKGLKPECSFHTLLKEINDINGLERIRFVTSHPKDLSDELIDTIATCDKICKHLHLPIQSGSNNILQKMKRGYTREDYLTLIEKLRKKVPNMVFTTDIIIGFPTETEEDNDQTLFLVQQVRYSNAFTFLYSKRTGTKAATMDGQVESSIATERFNKLLSILKPISYEINQEQVGTIQKVLIEDISKNDKELLTGRLDNNLLVHFKGDKNLIGQIKDIKITDCKTFYLLGELQN